MAEQTDAGPDNAGVQPPYNAAQPGTWTVVDVGEQIAIFADPKAAPLVVKAAFAAALTQALSQYVLVSSVVTSQVNPNYYVVTFNVLSSASSEAALPAVFQSVMALFGCKRKCAVGTPGGSSLKDALGSYGLRGAPYYGDYPAAPPPPLAKPAVQ